jgi:hypothetical protein
LADDPDPQVRFQAALSLANTAPVMQRTRVLSLAERDGKQPDMLMGHPQFSSPARQAMLGEILNPGPNSPDAERCLARS